MSDDPLRGGHIGEWPYRIKPLNRISTSYPYCGYSLYDPYWDMRVPYWLPQSDRCAWSPEIARERTRAMGCDREFFAALEAAVGREQAEARYQAQRRQALCAIASGLLLVVLVVVGAAV